MVLGRTAQPNDSKCLQAQEKQWGLVSQASPLSLLQTIAWWHVSLHLRHCLTAHDGEAVPRLGSLGSPSLAG